MTKRIFKSIIAVSVAAVIVTIAFITAFLNSYFTKRAANELRNEAELIVNAVELNGMDYLESADFKNLRATWIASDGTVLFDSQADASEMENHSDREEVKEAIDNGTGSAERYSETLTQKTLYYAQRLEDGTVIRVSSAHLSVWAQLIEMLQAFALIVLAVIVASGLLASQLSKRIVLPINKINPDNPDIDESYSELQPLLHKLRVQNKKITRQMNQLRRSREEFSLITENMSEGIIIADRNTIVLSCNPASLKLLGADMPEERQSIYAMNRSDEFRSCIQEAVKGGHSDCILESHSRVCRIIANPSYSGEELSGIVVFILDVTEKYNLEEMRREFTSNVSHELKTPLTAIYGIADMLANGIVKQEDVQKFGENIRSEAGRLIILINDIISLSKLDENNVPEEDRDIDLYNNAQDVINRLYSYAGERGIIMSLTGEHIIFRGNATIVDEIIYNLCDNAIKYNKENGTIKIGVEEDGGNAVITVEDTGIGIAQEHIERIFERFYRVDKSHSRKIKGTGLGLSIVKHGVKYHNGTIKCESTPESGTKFTVSLPLQKGKRDS
ncbi:MAG: PAS domain-containing protein [Ruminococcus sp.]|nr:PAS domain-containing protein [Ruminococcus sp.]